MYINVHPEIYDSKPEILAVQYKTFLTSKLEPFYLDHLYVDASYDDMDPIISDMKFKMRNPQENHGKLQSITMATDPTQWYRARDVVYMLRTDIMDELNKVATNMFDKPLSEYPFELVSLKTPVKYIYKKHIHYKNHNNDYNLD